MAKWQRLAEHAPATPPQYLLLLVDILNHTQNVKEQQFTLNDTRRRTVLSQLLPTSQSASAQ